MECLRSLPRLLPRAALATPNLDEVRLLVDVDVIDEQHPFVIVRDVLVPDEQHPVVDLVHRLR